MSMPPAESELLRELVRQVLSEVLPQTMAAAAESAPAEASGASASEVVHVASDADLQVVVRRIAAASDVERAAITSGATTFRLASPASSAPVPAGRSRDVVRIETGAVTERHVRDAASTGSSIHLGRKAVLTPLARDRARANGVEITKEQ